MSEAKVVSVIGERLGKLRQKLSSHDLSALIITSSENRRYFSGFTAADNAINSTNGCLLILPQRQYLLTDSRFTLMANIEAPEYEIITVGAVGYGEAIKKLIDPNTTLAFEANYLSFAQYQDYSKTNGLRLSPCPFDPSIFRLSKSPDEIKLISKALEITEKAVGWLFERLEPGWTEEETAWFLDSSFRELGAQGSAFETIAASGPQAAMPHAVAGPKKIEKGELVVIDCGAAYQGYAADISRTFMCGEPQKWQKDIYRTVREAQLMAIEAIGPGVSCQKVDSIARNHIAAAGHFEHFGHSLGHGVGLAVHESPRLSPKDNTLLVEGVVVTVEPGIYLPGQGGVRLEQMVLVTDNGAKVLNQDNHFYDF
ncbi:MAG: aminopeptidase P family protein [Deltaproteobacteria bacterium]|jgi:Xaa-Pro aminopeptidase|nr:aminopeptidase P family protein [Deltaproteobacteria bacterium]